MHTRPAEAVTDHDLAAVERADLFKALDDVVALSRFVDALTDSHQRRLGFLTPAGIEAQNDLVTKERRDRRQAQIHGLPTGTGDVAAPGNFNAVAVSAHLWFTLQDQIRKASRHLAGQGICLLRRVDDEPAVRDLATVLVHQVATITTWRVLHDIHTDLVELGEETQQFVDAVEASTPLGADCIHCERRTLVARFHDDVIRCERDPRTGHYEPCVCEDPLCSCKVDPAGHRHEWHRPRPSGPAPTWYALRDRLTLARTAGSRS